MPTVACRFPNAASIAGAAILVFCAVFTPALAQTDAGAANDTTKQAGIIKMLREKLRDKWNHVLHRNKYPIVLSPAQQAAIARMSKLPEIVHISVMKVPDAATVQYLLSRPFQEDDRFAKVVLPLTGDKDVTLLRALPTVRTDDGFTWRGKVEETDEPAVLMLWKDGHLSGYFAYKGQGFMVESLGGEVHTLAEFDPGKLPPDHKPGTKGTIARPVKSEPRVKPLPDAQRLALEAKQITIDIMLLYTKNAASHYIGDPSSALKLAIEQANHTFRKSGLGNITLRLVHTQAIEFEEAGVDQFDILYQMTDGSGAFKDVQQLRNEKRADIVGLIIDDPNGCGLSTRVGAEAEEAFFVVHHSCAVTTISIAHEIGHILGARHDRVVDANDTPVAYAHGYVNGAKWRTMMSYKNSCGDGCPRIPYWSNPRIKFKGEPTGSVANDNARVILEQAERVSKFR